MQGKDSIKGQIVDLLNREIFGGIVHVDNGRIKRIERVKKAPDHYILPGFVDAHIHIESSMLVPYEFARIALCHGTVATVSDPHEIANVMGLEGVWYMIDNAKDAKLKFHFGAPSCVPATSFETSGAELGIHEVKLLLASEEILYLSEMMNYPGVLNWDELVMAKIKAAKDVGKPIDGHAPGLKGDKARKYIEAGITTDHECYSLEEALDKLRYGMKIVIREGSAAKNYNTLHTLIGDYPDKLMFCSDDKHPDDLLEGHIDQLVKRSLKLGYNLFDVLRMASVNPVQHYGLDVGLLREGDRADFIVVKDLEGCKVLKTVINGEIVAENGECFLVNKKHRAINRFQTTPKNVQDFETKGPWGNKQVIEAIDGELITEKLKLRINEENGVCLTDPENDILKISIVNRYRDAPVKSGFVKNFGIQNGAIASTVAHDSHNIIVVGSHDHWICRAVNLLIDAKGGLSAVSDDFSKVMPLPVAGLMSTSSAYETGMQYKEMDALAKKLGSRLTAPYMTLSFMGLLVIPKIKMSDLGLFDAEEFVFY